jgi:hypothetical protein
MLGKSRLLLLALGSFITTFLLSFFTPGSIASRTTASALCGVLGANTTLCSVELGKWGDRAVAADVPVWVAQRSSEFDGTASEGPSNESNIPAYPHQVSPRQPLRGDFDPSSGKPTIRITSDDTSEVQVLLDELASMNGPGSALAHIPEELCQMKQTLVDTYKDGLLLTKGGVKQPNTLKAGAAFAKELPNLPENTKKVLDSMNKLLKISKIASSGKDIPERIIGALAKKMLTPELELDLDCSRYSTPSNERLDACKTCTYRVNTVYMRGDGKEIREPRSIFADCDNGLGAALVSAKRQIANLDAGEARIENERGLPRSTPRKIIGIPERLTSDSERGLSCGGVAGPTAARAATQEVQSMCNVPQSFWKSNKRHIVGVEMDEYICVIRKPVMTSGGMVDGQNQCGTCSLYDGTGTLPALRSCKSPDDPYRQNEVPICPGF